MRAAELEFCQFANMNLERLCLPALGVEGTEANRSQPEEEKNGGPVNGPWPGPTLTGKMMPPHFNVRAFAIPTHFNFCDPCHGALITPDIHTHNLMIQRQSHSHHSSSRAVPSLSRMRRQAHEACSATKSDSTSTALRRAGNAESPPALPRATATFLSSRSLPILLTAEPRNRSSNSVWPILRRSSRSGLDTEVWGGLGHSGDPPPRQSKAFQGQTSWQMSHPYTQVPTRGLSSSGIEVFSSIVR